MEQPLAIETPPPPSPPAPRPTLPYDSRPLRHLGPGDFPWLRSVRNGAALVFLAGAAALWWPRHPFGFDVEPRAFAFVLNSLPLVVPILLGWWGTWALLRRRETRAGRSVPAGLWRWGVRLGVTAFSFLPLTLSAMDALSIDPGVTMAQVEPYVAKAAPVLTGLLCVHAAVLAWTAGARPLAASFALLAAGLPIALGAMLRMNEWHLQFKQIMPPFHPVVGVGYPAVVPITIGFVADHGLRVTWRAAAILGVGAGAAWALVAFPCLAVRFAGAAREAKRVDGPAVTP